MHYARTVSVNGDVLPQESWQRLEEHLANVSAAASRFASTFDAGAWAQLAGLWHDFGKYHPDFQAMLTRAAQGLPTDRVDHSSAGAIYASKFIEVALAKAPKESRELLADMLAFPIAGHHAGLADGHSELQSRLERAQVLSRYETSRSECQEAAVLDPKITLSLPPQLRCPAKDLPLRAEFLLRMLFSSLVDADRLDAEQVQDMVLPAERRVSDYRTSFAPIPALRAAIDKYLDSLVAGQDHAPMRPDQRRLFDYRQEVLSACREAAELEPGAFLLDVATGGGKTLSSLSFALRHAEKRGKQRVIVVIPFTSIIEQTAAVYRSALGELATNVIEHHSAVSECVDREVPSATAERRRLATENWDAPLIVTTAVQFFESLHASTPSKCRKLHNVCNSVIVIDEAQTLPPELLHPTIWALNELVEGYGCSVVLSTATQPALERPFPEIRNVRTRIEPAPLPARVRAELLAPEIIEWPLLAGELARHPQVLCITHRRDDARELTLELDRALGDESTIHLSANMCAAHRSTVIEEIREKSTTGQSCRVVSTQLVEAGVDLDFPVV